MLPVEAQQLLTHGNDHLADIVSKNSSGNNDFLSCHEGDEVAGHEDLNNADEASRLSSGTLRVPLLASQGSQHSKAASRPLAGDPSLDSLTLQCQDAPLAHFMKSTTLASMD